MVDGDALRKNWSTGWPRSTWPLNWRTEWNISPYRIRQPVNPGGQTPQLRFTKDFLIDSIANLPSVGRNGLKQ